jgi:hypothetical protein
MSLPDISVAELTIRYTDAKAVVDRELQLSNGEKTPKVIHAENVALRLLLEIKIREIASLKDSQVNEVLETASRDREVDGLRKELTRVTGILEERKWVEESRNSWRDRCGRAERAIRSANYKNEQYHRALCDAYAKLGSEPPTEDELRKTFGTPETPRAGKYRKIAPTLALSWPSKFS